MTSNCIFFSQSLSHFSLFVLANQQMIVEEMNILNTVFLRFDNEKIYYPNSVLATKPISNFYRSPDMSDSFEFSIDFRTHLENIGALKEKIKKWVKWYFHFFLVFCVALNLVSHLIPYFFLPVPTILFNEFQVFRENIPVLAS